MNTSTNVIVNNLPLNFQFMEVLEKQISMGWRFHISVDNYSIDIFWNMDLKWVSPLSLLQFLIDFYFRH